MATAEKVESKNEKASVKNVGQLDHDAVEEISGELRHLLADSFALYLKTKNFHWHMTGKNFRDYHLLLDEQGDQGHSATQASFEELEKVWGVSHDTGKLWQQDWSKSVYPVENGVFVATLPADPVWEIGKRFPVLLPNVSA